MATESGKRTQIRVAIIGGGPAGLAVAIALSELAYVDWALYEKKPEISEIGSGLTLQPNTWRILEKLGVSHHILADDIFRPVGGHRTSHRNGRTGHLLARTIDSSDRIAPHQESCRTHRANLQNALLRKVSRKRVFTGKKLTQVTRLEAGSVSISFEDGFVSEVDLLIGADGIRSVVRQFAFPSHGIQYTGSTAYRTLVRSSDVSKINGLHRDVIFWHGTDGKWVYTCPLGGDDWEITCAIKEPGGEQRTSWGKPASVQHFLDSFFEFCQPVQELFKLITYVEQYDYFAGPRLESAVNLESSIALIGDASHPLSGAFGAGAGFALEDAYVLAKAIDWAWKSNKQLSEALQLFDEVRSPHYKDLYDVLDGFATVNNTIEKQSLKPDDEISQRVLGLWGERSTWMYYYEVDKVLEKTIEKRNQDSSMPVIATARL